MRRVVVDAVDADTGLWVERQAGVPGVVEKSIQRVLRLQIGVETTELTTG